MNKAFMIDKIEKEVKYLVIDDEIAASQQYRQSFIDDIAILGTSAIFAANCTEALTIIKQNSDIFFCFLDCKLPKTKAGSLNYSPQDDVDAGIDLIPEISQIEPDFLMIIFSGYVDKVQLRKRVNKYSSNIIDCLNKNDSSEEYRKAAIKALNSRKIFIGDHAKLKDTSKNADFEKNLPFDYEQLAPETQSMLKEKAREIQKLLRRSARDIYDIGRYLTEVKQSLQHGYFYPWLRSELKWSSTSAVRFMKVYEKFKSFNLDNLNIVPSALYELSNNAIPDEVLLKTIEIAESGETVTVELAKSIKKKYQKKRTEKYINTISAVPDPSLSSTGDESAVEDKASITEKAVQREASLLVPGKEKANFIKQDIVKIISPQRIWHLGKQQQHTLACQDPNSTKFIEQLPSNIDLCLAFPPSQKWQFECNRYKSMMTFYSEYQDLDRVGLLESIKHAIEITTNAKDIIAVCFIPHLKILSLIELLECRAIVADPNRDKCLALVEASQRTN